MSGVTQLKLDITVLASEDIDSSPLVLNFNIPVGVVETNVPLTFDQVLTDISNYIVSEFDPSSVLFQVTATYYLSNTKTGDRRLWTGSFYPSGNHSASLSGFIFLSFDNPQAFVQRVKEYSEPRNVVACLQWGGEESHWIFDGLASIIPSVQISVPKNHNFLLKNGLLQNRPRHQRRALTKIHPF